MGLTRSAAQKSNRRERKNGGITPVPMARPDLSGEEIERVVAVLHSGLIAQGMCVKAFEDCFAAYIGTREAVAVNNGTAALHTALLAAGVGPGDEVITTPFSFIATANAVLYCNARPVFVDIEDGSFNISADLIEAKITPRTKAVVIVHLYGLPCDMEPILAVCQRYGLALIEDACQAHGAEYKGRKVGSFGLGCFSFYPTKNMTTGEGGMITTDDPRLAEKMRLVRSHGQPERYRHDVLGYNYRMTEIAAAIGIVQLEKLDTWNERRIANASYLMEAIDTEGIVLPHLPPDRKHVFHQFTVRVTPACHLSRSQLQQVLQSYGIDSAVYYPLPIHKQPLYLGLGYNDRLPVSEKAAQEVLSLPVHPQLTEGSLARIAAVVANV